MNQNELNYRLARILGAALYGAKGELLASSASSIAVDTIMNKQVIAREEVISQASWRRFSTDTRTMQRGDIFVALVGANFDGHDYLSQASQKGASAAIISSSRWEDKRQEWQAEGLNLPLFVVEDTLVAYQKLATYYREAFLPCLVAITGSVGKTSTREMVSCALEACMTVYRTEENLNNEIGVPKTVLAAPTGTAATVVEMGMDRPGDIRFLTNMTKPDIAIITGIGFSHLEFFCTQEAILRAKAEIVEGLKADGHLLLHARDSYLLQLARELAQVSQPYKMAFVYACEEGETYALSLPGPCFVAENMRSDDFGLFHYDLYLYAEGKGAGTCLAREILVPVAGKHHVVNSLFALLSAYLLHQPLAKAISGLSRFTVVGNRQRMLEIGSMTVMNDSYNAAPESMMASLRTLALMAKRQKRRSVAILGCIAELGRQAPKIHFELGQSVAMLGIDCFYACGDYAQDLANGIEEANPSAQIEVFETRDQLGDFVIPRLLENDIILIKGSRFYKMELICDRMIAETMEK